MYYLTGGRVGRAVLVAIVIVADIMMALALHYNNWGLGFWISGGVLLPILNLIALAYLVQMLADGAGYVLAHQNARGLLFTWGALVRLRKMDGGLRHLVYSWIRKIV